MLSAQQQTHISLHHSISVNHIPVENPDINQDFITIIEMLHILLWKINWKQCVIYLIPWVLLSSNSVQASGTRENFGLFRRVIGGESIETGEWPWLVSLKGKIPVSRFLGLTVSYNLINCGGSLINSRWILTAAHCVVSEKYGNKSLTPQYWEARMGDSDLKATVGEYLKDFLGDLLNKDEWKDWTVTAEKIVVHPGYDPFRQWANDVALLKLSSNVPASAENVERIQSIKLNSAGNTAFPRDGQECIFKGWGCVAEGAGSSPVAFKVALPKVSDERCHEIFSSPLEPSSRMCAGYDLAEKGICSGDSGGPLVCKMENDWIQVGIASFASKDQPQNFPGVFASVSYYRDWIDKIIREEES